MAHIWWVWEVDTITDSPSVPHLLGGGVVQVDSGNI